MTTLRILLSFRFKEYLMNKIKQPHDMSRMEFRKDRAELVERSVKMFKRLAISDDEIMKLGFENVSITIMKKIKEEMEDA